MGYAFYKVNDQVYIGDTAAFSPQLLSSPYNYLSEDQQELYSSSVPVTMTLITVDPAADIPYRLTVFSPGYYLYAELGHEEYREQVLTRGQHLHNTYEIVYTREGEFYQQIEARRYKYTAKSCCLLNRNIRHREEYISAFSTVTLSLSPEFLRDTLGDPYDHFFADRKGSSEITEFFSTDQRKSYLNFTPADENREEVDPIHGIFDQLAQIILTPAPGSSFLFRELVCRMLDMLSEPECYSTRLVNLGTEAESKVFSQITHLMEESHGRISRNDLTKQLNYSGNYLNRIVNKYTGMSIFRYGTYFAMQHAAWLLRHSKMTVTEIAEELGFTDRTHFYKLFKEEFGETPRQFRKKEEK